MTGTDFWNDVLRRVRAIDQLSYYEHLGVARGAGGEEVREAFVARVTEFHPDRHAREIETEPERARALVSLQARLNEAYRVLSNPQRRADYDRAVAGGQMRLIGRAGTRPAAADPINHQAKRYYELGLQCERSRDVPGAAMHFGFALQLEPESAAIRAALARLGIATPAERGASVAPATPTPPQTPPPPLEPRQHERLPYARPIQLRCRDWKHFITLHTRDLSRGGLFVKTASPLAIGTGVQLSLILPDGTSLDLAATVTHIVTADRARPDAMAGMGLRFEADDERNRKIDELVRHAVGAAARGG